nr:uncharacterized protein LOC112938964 [Oryza sativa Japonica Group]
MAAPASSRLRHGLRTPPPRRLGSELGLPRRIRTGGGRNQPPRRLHRRIHAHRRRRRLGIPPSSSPQESAGASTAASLSSAQMPTSSTVVDAATSPTPCATVELHIAAAEVATPELGRGRGLRTPRPQGEKAPPPSLRPCGFRQPLSRQRGGRRAMGVVWRKLLGRLPCRPCPGSDAEGKTVYLGLRLVFLGCLLQLGRAQRLATAAAA